MSWSYGITTVPQRFDNYFQTTLNSLKSSGFDKPRIFVDKAEHIDHFPGVDYKPYGPVTYRESIGTPPHWMLTLAELYYRDPQADMYGIFQDDFIMVKDVKQYIDTHIPPYGYLNLYTFPSNQSICPEGHKGWYQSNQLGRGAVALIFPKDTAVDLLSQRHMWERAQGPRRHKAVDGGICETMKKAGVKEFVHNPSLVQHIGENSSMRNSIHLQATSFPGEEWSVLDLG